MAAYEGFAVLEIMGHRRHGGFVSEVEIAGAKCVRIDTANEPSVTHFYGGAAIFCLTPCTEEAARAADAASVGRSAPIQPWELPTRQLPPGGREIDGDVSPTGADRDGDDGDDF